MAVEGDNKPTKIEAGPAFKWSLIAVFSLTVLLLLITVALAVWADPSDEVSQVSNLTSDGFKLGLGAILGLIGGKTAA